MNLGLLVFCHATNLQDFFSSADSTSQRHAAHAAAGEILEREADGLYHRIGGFVRIERDLSGDIGQVRTWSLRRKVPNRCRIEFIRHVIKCCVWEMVDVSGASWPLLKRFSTMASVPFHHVSTIFVLP